MSERDNYIRSGDLTAETKFPIDLMPQLCEKLTPILFSVIKHQIRIGQRDSDGNLLIPAKQNRVADNLGELECKARASSSLKREVRYCMSKETISDIKAQYAEYAVCNSISDDERNLDNMVFRDLEKGFITGLGMSGYDRLTPEGNKRIHAKIFGIINSQK